MAAYNIGFGCNFLGTKSAGMDRVGCGKDDRGNNNIQKKMRDHGHYILESIDMLIAMIWQCLDFTIYMYVEKRGTLRYIKIN